jgi:hypothetical protein
MGITIHPVATDDMATLVPPNVSDTSKIAELADMYVTIKTKLQERERENTDRCIGPSWAE